MNAFTCIETDLAYALRQLREHRCIDRAIDALERIEERVTAAKDAEVNILGALLSESCYEDEDDYLPPGWHEEMAAEPPTDYDADTPY